MYCFDISLVNPITLTIWLYAFAQFSLLINSKSGGKDGYIKIHAIPANEKRPVVQWRENSKFYLLNCWCFVLLPKFSSAETYILPIRTCNSKIPGKTSGNEYEFDF